MHGGLCCGGERTGYRGFHCVVYIEETYFPYHVCSTTNMVGMKKKKKNGITRACCAMSR
jgi:hypothetical protein